ncbi:MAG TPA: hypothetical protein ENK43_17145 [Planctomycetes bacterium]|nr:hypothetical protein [Planctomycetota bacterium]
MKTLRNWGARWVLVAIVLAGAWTLGGGTKAELGLGSPASAVIAEFGHPDKISHASSNQTWFFLNDEGVLIPRVVINQGLVVEIRK